MARLSGCYLNKFGLPRCGLPAAAAKRKANAMTGEDKAAAQRRNADKRNEAKRAKRAAANAAAAEATEATEATAASDAATSPPLASTFINRKYLPSRLRTCSP